MPPPQDIVDLIARFARNIGAYKAGRYNETQLRREFIDPFFTAAKTPDEKTALQRQITATDNQIDQLVYELYNLTKEEIKIVEGATASN